MKNHLLLLGCLMIISCQPTSTLFDDALCIENITTIDAINGLRESQTVIIKAGKIFKISPTSDLPLSPENDIVDGTGKFLIPGLWDAHVHFAYMEELAPRMHDLFLAYGITSLRDTGGKIDFVRKWKAQSLANPTTTPRLMIAGPLLDGLPNVYDGSDPMRPPLSVGLGSKEAVEQKIEELDSLGVDLLKAYEMLTPEQFSAATALGQEKGLKVTGHVPLSMDVISASNAGLNSMEHMRNLELSCASNAEELLQQRRQLLSEGRQDPGGVLRSRIHQTQRATAIENYDPKVAEKVLQVLAKNQTWQIPTITLSTAFTELPFATEEWQSSFAYLPDSVEQRWKQGIATVAAQEKTTFQKNYSKWLMNMVKQVHSAGIDMMAGTDTPIFFLTPGRSLHEELAVLVTAGLSPLDALKTATLNPARYFGLEQELGSIEEQKWADLLLLDANPLEDITNTQRIRAVVKQGNLINREQLDQLLAKLSSEK